MAVAVPGVELPGHPDHGPGTGGREIGITRGGGRAQFRLGQPLVYVRPQDLLGPVAEQVLRGDVPVGDQAGPVGHDNGVPGRLGEAAEGLLGGAQRLQAVAQFPLHLALAEQGAAQVVPGVGQAAIEPRQVQYRGGGGQQGRQGQGQGLPVVAERFTQGRDRALKGRLAQIFEQGAHRGVVGRQGPAAEVRVLAQSLAHGQQAARYHLHQGQVQVRQDGQGPLRVEGGGQAQIEAGDSPRGHQAHRGEVQDALRGHTFELVGAHRAHVHRPVEHGGHHRVLGPQEAALEVSDRVQTLGEQFPRQGQVAAQGVGGDRPEPSPAQIGQGGDVCPVGAGEDHPAVVVVVVPRDSVLEGGDAEGIGLDLGQDIDRRIDQQQVHPPQAGRRYQVLVGQGQDREAMAWEALAQVVGGRCPARQGLGLAAQGQDPDAQIARCLVRCLGPGLGLIGTVGGRGPRAIGGGT